MERYLSQPNDEAKSAGRGLAMLGVILVAGIIAGVATLTWTVGFFWHFVAVELLVAICLYAGCASS